METINVLGDDSTETTGLVETDDRLVPFVRLNSGSRTPQLAIDVHLPTAFSDVRIRSVAVNSEVLGIDF